MRRLWLISLTLILGLPQTQAQLRQVENQTFQAGEFLKYRIHYGPITAGFATLEVEPRTYYVQERPCYHIVMKGFTHPSFDWFFKVRDVYETYFDQEALVSWRFNRHIVEGSFDRYTETHFDHYTGYATFVNHKQERIRHKVPTNIQDVISAYYFARTYYDHTQLQPGEKISLRNFIDQKTVGLEAVMLKRETVEIEEKNYDALKFSLLIDEADLVTDGSTIVFWVSYDKNKIPLRIESDLMIGSLKADLIEWDNLLHPISEK